MPQRSIEYNTSIIIARNGIVIIVWEDEIPTSELFREMVQPY